MGLLESFFGTIKVIVRPNITSAFLILLLNGILAYFFFNYCFLNPDGYPNLSDCHATYGIKYGFDHSSLADSKVAREFHAWLLLGLILNGICILYSILAFIYVASKSKAVWIVTNFVGVIMIIGTLFQITSGIITRFRFEG